MDSKIVDKIGWFASIMAILMFSSYIDQIRLNLTGRPGSILLPIFTTINGFAWISYALLKEKKDWPVFTCNVLAVILGIATTLTTILPFH